MPVSNVAVGDLDVFDSGTVTVFGGDSLELTLEHPEDDDIRLVFEFREDGGEAHMDPGEIDPVEGATLSARRSRSTSAYWAVERST